MREKSPKELALLTCLAVGFVTFGLIIGATKVISNNANTFLATVVAIPVIVLTYLVVYFVVKEFIYEKIKLIYKTINQEKIERKGDAKALMDGNILANVNRQVVHWASDQKREIAELKEKETFRREFIGNLAHELKTPITSIQGYILTLLEGALEDPNINRSFLMKASKNVDRLVMLTEDLDALTKYESQKLQPEFEKFSLVELVSDVFDTLAYKAEEKKVHLRFFDEYETNFFVFADKGMYAQIFTNLLSNSIVYGKENGESIVRFFDMDEHYLVEVSDNGIGISQEDLPRVFERFYRVDKSRSRHEGGSGLGLAIVKHILEAHNQTISASSVVDKGTTFSFTVQKFNPEKIK
jgi:two-component system phosphate regulon sensor histidine kinase PhoR